MLEDLALHMVAQNPAKLVEMLKKMAIRIDIRDERKLHNDIAGILNMVNSVSLEEIKVTVIIDKFKEILFENRIVMPDYFMLLVRGIILIESVGRTLNPEMNIIKSIEPFIAGVIKKRISPEYLIKKGLSLLGELREDAQNVPMEMRQTLKKLHQGNLKIQVENHEMHSLGKTIEKSISNLMLSLLIAALIIATSIISTSDSKIASSGNAVLLMLGLTFGLTIYLIIRVLRR
ncbi:MAG: hypothetical protein IT269_06875, partial [Saprospiraceae bacterium]|nr:hypothetical protein [Saprospiraceae bacterium]